MTPKSSILQPRHLYQYIVTVFLVTICSSSSLFSQTYNVPRTGNATITTCSGTLYDSGGTNNYETNSNGYIVINPSNTGSYITLSGTGDTESNYDFLRIYDGAGTSGALLWSRSGSGTSAFTIPSITSLSGPITVFFSSDGSVTRSGFEITISCSTTPPPPASLVPNTGNTSITTCNQTIFDNGGSASNYSNNSNGYLVINPATTGSYIQFNGTGSTEQTHDVLTIYDGVGTDGSILFTASGDFTIPNLTSISGPITIHFRSDGSINNIGFQINVNCSNTPGSLPLIVPTTGTQNYSLCDGTITDSGGLNGNYLNNNNGIAIIQPSTTGSFVQFSGTVRTQANNDFLYIYDGVGTNGRILWSGSGAQNIPTITSYSGPITIHFTSNSSTVNQGFVLNISCSTTAGIPTNIVPSSGNNSLTICSGQLYDAGGATGLYPNNSNGYTVINPAIPGSYIQVSGTINTETTNDIVYIYDGIGITGALLWSGTGAATIPSTTSVSGPLTVRFTSNSSTVDTGFSITISCTNTAGSIPLIVPSNGSSSLTVCSGVLLDNGGASNYVNNANGFTVLYPEFIGRFVEVSGTMQTESNYDFLNIYDGVGTGGTLLWSGSGNLTIPTITSASGPITVQFISDGSTNYSGFELAINCSTTPGSIPLVVPITGTNSYTLCSGTITDNGGASNNYSNSTNGTAVIYPETPGTYVQVTGTGQTESNYDILTIYDGVGTGGNLLWSGSGAINFTGITSITGPITIHFKSDFSTNYYGFEIQISCSTIPSQINNPCDNISNITSCGNTITTTIEPNGLGFMSSTSCSTTTTGLEAIYSYTPTESGNYTIRQINSYTTVAYQYKRAGDGCNPNGWQCISSLNGTATSETFFLTSGVEYYFLLDTTSNTGGSISFILNCTEAPCSSGDGMGETTLSCPSVETGGLGLSGADPQAIECGNTAACVELEANYLQIGQTDQYIVESIPYNPPYQFDCLANPVSVNVDDVWSPIVNLPFNFCFFGVNYNQCMISSNGVITFDTTTYVPGGYSTWLFDQNLPNPQLFRNTIFGVYHDIDPEEGGHVAWELITLNSGCRALVASWSDIPMFSASCNHILYSGMIVLYEDTNIIEVYVKEKNLCESWNNGNAIIGIQNQSGTLAYVAPDRNGLSPNWTATNEAWRFVPSGDSVTSIKWYEGSGTNGPIVGTTDVITVCPSETTVYTAEVTYELCDGRILAQTDQTTVTINKSKTWNGSIDTDWDKDNNWTPPGVPTPNDCIVIPVTSNDPIISGSSYTGWGLNMIIHNDAILTINSNNFLTITEWVDLQPSSRLNLHSSASLIQVENITNRGSGKMFMDRTVNMRRLDYVYWSSPTSGFNSGQISPNTQSNYIWKWMPTMPGNGIGNAGTWVSGVENMVIGKGYIVRGPGNFDNTYRPFTAQFIGTPNNGTISTDIDRGSYNHTNNYPTPNSTTLASRLDDNWNLIGNPYPSAIDALDFLELNTNIDGFVKLWTHGTLPSAVFEDPFYQEFVLNYTIDDYITFNASGSSLGPGTFNGKIASGQSFFVNMLHGGSVSQNVYFNNSMRHHTFNNSMFFRNAQENNLDRIWLDISDENRMFSRSLIGYIPGATDDYDRLYDAITDPKASMSIYSFIEDEGYTIQGKNTPFENNDRIPLGIKVPEDGNYSISIATMGGHFKQNHQEVILEDTYTQTEHYLNENGYTFYTLKGNCNDRFILKFIPNSLSSESYANANTLVVKTSNILTVESTGVRMKNIRIYDISGKKLYEKNNVNDFEIQIPQIHKHNAALIIQVEYDNGRWFHQKALY